MHINIVRIKAVAQVLSSLEEEFVFVGGATVALYIDNPDWRMKCARQMILM